MDSCTTVSHLQIKSIQIHLFEEKIAITNILKQLALCKSMHNSINTKILFYKTVTWNKTLLSGIREMSARNSTIIIKNLTPSKSQQFLLKHFNHLWVENTVQTLRSKSGIILMLKSSNKTFSTESKHSESSYTLLKHKHTVLLSKQDKYSVTSAL